MYTFLIDCDCDCDCVVSACHHHDDQCSVSRSMFCQPNCWSSWWCAFNARNSASVHLRCGRDSMCISMTSAGPGSIRHAVRVYSIYSPLSHQHGIRPDIWADLAIYRYRSNFACELSRSHSAICRVPVTVQSATMVVLHYGSMSGHHAIPLRYFNRTIGVSECMCQLHAFPLKKKMREKKMRKNYEVYRLYLMCMISIDGVIRSL